MFLSVIPHDWQREFNAWIVNETGWLKQGEHSVKAGLLSASGKAGRALIDGETWYCLLHFTYCISRREMIYFTV